ncbi:hypothetical protein [Methanosalsum natronophilum]|uniref:hypothetical protein n=1 Tax=Methanosalsum natronophilum TaxID=768733 RepID=UPI002166DBAA|nr:hypothetical protein [Methanosalsum natronophilum]MCS3923125.1 hypothetical protein [Methanosalsum natronophilum]
MISGKKLIATIFIALIILLIFSGTAFGSFKVDDPTLTQGESYQINSYLIEATLVSESSGTADIRIYEIESVDDFNEIERKMLDVNDTLTFDFQENGEVEVKLTGLIGRSTLDRAELAIYLSGYSRNDIHISEIIDYGDDPKFVGSPDIKITKEADETVEIGEPFRVTVRAENVGDGKAVDLEFTDNHGQGLSIEDTILEDKGPMSLDAGDSKTILIYELKATQPGEVELGTTTARYYDEAGNRFDSESDELILDVEGTLQKADVSISHTVESKNIERNSRLDGTISLRNDGNTAAKGLRVDIELPPGVEFVSGDDEIETRGGNPSIYIESFSQRQQIDVSYTVRPTDIGEYNIGANLSYEYDDGFSDTPEEVNKEATVEGITVIEAWYDFLLEYPLYVYAVPLVIIGGIGLFIIHRQKQYKF